MFDELTNFLILQKLMFTRLRSYIIYSQLVAVVVIAIQIVSLDMTQITGIWKSKSLTIPTGSLFPLPVSSLCPCSHSSDTFTIMYSVYLTLNWRLVVSNKQMATIPDNIKHERAGL